MEPSMTSALSACRTGQDVHCFLPKSENLRLMECFDQNVAQESEVVFLLDSSGSMQNYWPQIATSINDFTSSRSHSHVLKWADTGCIRKSPLIKNLFECTAVDQEKTGVSLGYGTNITESVHILGQLLQEQLQLGSRTFVVVFVSDGMGSVLKIEDAFDVIRALISTYSSTAGSIAPSLEFTTLGIGRCFPTSVAMKLRNALHSGRSVVPLVSIAREVDDFPTALDSLKEIFVMRSPKLLVSGAALRLNSWTDPADTLMLEAGDLFVVGENARSIKLSTYPDGPCEELQIHSHAWTADLGIAVFKQYLWKLQAAALQGGDGLSGLRARAQVCLNQLFQAGEECEGQSFGRKETTKHKLTVSERIAKKLEKGKFLVIDGLKKEFRFLAEGSNISELKDEEMAQRLAIGTLEGKYHRDAILWKGLNAADFPKIRDKFLKLLRRSWCVKDDLQAVADREDGAGLRSAISLDGNADILTQQDLICALSKVSSQYFLVEVLPVVGLAVQLVRSNASMINPWALRAIALSVHTPVVDSVSVLKAGTFDMLQGVQTTLNTGAGDYETVSAVCCIVATVEDAELMRPYLTSQLYQILHTYCACGNVDVLDRSAHPALLAAVLCFMLGDMENGIRREVWMDMVLQTLRGLYPGYGASEKSFVAAMMRDAGSAMVTESPESETKCQSMSKPIALALAWKDCIDEFTRYSIVEHICKEWIGRSVRDKRGYGDWFSLRSPRYIYRTSDEVETDEEGLLHAIRPLSNYYLESDVERAVRRILGGVKVTVKHDGVELNATSDGRNALLNEFRDGAVLYPTLKHFGRLFLENPAWDIDEDALKRYLSHAVEHGHSSYDRRVNADSFDEMRVERVLVRGLTTACETALLVRLQERARSEWYEEMRASHDIRLGNKVLPMTLQEIRRARAELGLAESDTWEEEVGYRPDVGLCKRICMFAQCPFYLTYDPRRPNVGQHIRQATSVCGGVVPALFVTLSACLQNGIDDEEQIFAAVAEGRYMLRSDAARQSGIYVQMMAAKDEYMSAIGEIKRKLCVMKNLREDRQE